MIQNLENTSATASLPGIRKAAILLVILGDQISGEILKQMDEDEVQMLGREVARVVSIGNDQAEEILEEFYQMSVAREYVLKGGIDYAKKMLMNAFGPEHAKKMVDRLVKTLGSETASFDTLQKADPQQLAKFIHNEHPRPSLSSFPI
jgi:flagellar motor switch protein FliG